MTEKDVEILEKTTRYKGFFRIEFYRLRHRLFAGGWSGEVHRELFERGQAAGVLPYDPTADAVVLIEQFRLGAMIAGLPAWQTEVVAGIIEASETAESVARREAREEAGCEVLDLVPMCRYAVSPGGASESCQLFCGRVNSRGVGGVHGVAAEHEDIRVHVMAFAEALRLLETTRVGNAITIIALQWLALHRDRLRQRWLSIEGDR